jgi:2-(1,2-epoxy-1,2-dihydrophenyl)acetyl-CoA isomerase
MEEHDQADLGVSSEVADSVATIRMLRPALTTAMKGELLAAASAAAGDDAVRAIVLTGTGKVFCAGQDLADHAEALSNHPDTAFTTLRRHYNPLVRALTNAPKPVIAAINGSCAGAGLSLALACDLRVAAAGARFATAFTAIGLSFDSGLSATLARAVGTARASELILLGEPFTAEQALAWGLVGRVVPPTDLDQAVSGIASKLAAGPTRAYAAAKRAITGAWTAPLSSVLEAEAATQAGLGATRDHRQAVQSFINKQPPVFTGRD